MAGLFFNTKKMLKHEILHQVNYLPNHILMSDSIITEEFENHKKKSVKWTNHIHLTNDSGWENV